MFDTVATDPAEVASSSSAIALVLAINFVVLT